MSVLAVRASIVETLQANLPAGVQVLAHGGRFDSAEEIKRYITKGPAVLVACIRIPLACPGTARVMMPAGWAIFVITKDVPGAPRDQGAIALAEAVLLQIDSNLWGRSDVAVPSDIEARNLYSAKVDNLGVALWAVTFTQVVTDLVVDPSTLNNFVTFHEDIDMAPADGQIDITQTTELPQE